MDLVRGLALDSLEDVPEVLPVETVEPVAHRPRPDRWAAPHLEERRAASPQHTEELREVDAHEARRDVLQGDVAVDEVEAVALESREADCGVDDVAHPLAMAVQLLRPADHLV